MEPEPPTAPHLPSMLSSFVGRAAELDELTALVARHRLVTVAGPGGVGKTRLVHRLAQQRAGTRPGWVGWADLSSTTTPEAAAEVVAQACGVAPVPGRPLAEALASVVAPDGLLVIDNAEHQVPVLTGLVEPILAATGVSVVVTSREPLGVTGEQVWRAASLSLPTGLATPDDLAAFDATALFVERARSVRHNLVIDGEGAEAVARICRRLDGIPLAIELAAARARAMTLPAMEAALATSFHLLTGSRHTASSRQGTVEASIRWSYELLDEREQAVLRRVAVMAAPFDLDGAEAVAGGADGGGDGLGGGRGQIGIDAIEVLDLLTRLVDKSLVDFDGGAGRYRLLETTRQFALARLHDHGETTATRRRHATHYAGLALRTGSFGTGLRLTDLTPDVGEVLAAFDWWTVDDPDQADELLAAAALTVFGLGRWTDLQRACDWLLAERHRGPAWVRAAANTSVVAALLGRVDVGEAFGAALAAGAGGDDPEVGALLEAGQAYAEIVAGRLGTARSVLDRAAANRWTVPAFLAGTGLVVVLAAHGRRSEAERVADAVGGQGLDRESLVTSSAVGPALCRLALLAGDPAGARQLVRTPSGSWSMMSVLWAATAAEVALATGDAYLMERARSWATVDDTPDAAALAAVVAWAAAAASGDGLAALAAARAAAGAQFHHTGVIGSAALVTTLVALGRWDEVADGATALEARAAEGGEPGPWPGCVAGLARGWAGLAGGDRAEAERCGHQVLRESWAAGLGLATIDALELLAALGAGRRSGATAGPGRLAGAAAAARERSGYRSPLRPAPLDAALASLRTRAADAWSEGERLDLGAAVELAGRARGPRGRPSYGPTAWTPTERLVAELCATGLSNEEIATRLLVSVRTVKTHLTHVYAKVGVRNRAELIARFPAPPD